MSKHNAKSPWQPIETATKDQWVLVSNGHLISRGIEVPRGWIVNDPGMDPDELTHWMPIPPLSEGER